jgi:multidrug transporter EmrE-like cation transporter
MPKATTMFLFIFSISLAILSTVLYHLAQKLTPSGASPVLAIPVTYLTALVVCLVILALAPPRPSLFAALRQLSWTSYALAFSIVGIEFGFLLAFRAGWNISLAALFVNAAGTLLLAPIGLIFFKEKLTPVNLAGMLLCLVGLIMMNWKK